ncbi:MAG: hypothetical protein WDO24_25370 [Pseudomonadota bacterium]
MHHPARAVVEGVGVTVSRSFSALWGILASSASLIFLSVAPRRDRSKRVFPSFDQAVGLGEQRRRQVEPEIMGVAQC